MTFTVNKLSDTGAAEILGLDCSRPLAAETLAALDRTMLDHPVTVIRDQVLTAAQQAAFSRQLGPLEAQDRKTYCHPDDPDVLVLSNEVRPDGTAVGIVDAGDFWHSDSSHLPEPCKRTVLYAVRNPAHGGDTEYCNMYQVYDALPVDLKRQVAGRYGIHHISKLKNPRVKVSAARRFTIGIADMPDGAAQPLLDRHQACGGYSLPDIRRMHRTTIRGDRPFYRPAA